MAGITLDSFSGFWHITRDIRDDRGPDAHFTGCAEFTRCADGLWMQERGQMQMGGQSFNATRRYLWARDGAGIAVLFEDGRLFHRFHPAERTAADHWCDPDAYAVRYEFTQWPLWSATWNVQGPRKSYRMTSHFSRNPLQS